MPNFTQLHHPGFSLWQSAVEQTIAKAATAVEDVHGAYPVGITEIPATPRFNVPMENVVLTKGTAFYSHGYAMMELDGAAARVSYYQDSDHEDQPMFVESFGAAAAGH